MRKKSLLSDSQTVEYSHWPIVDIRLSRSDSIVNFSMANGVHYRVNTSSLAYLYTFMAHLNIINYNLKRQDKVIVKSVKSIRH